MKGDMLMNGHSIDGPGLLSTRSTTQKHQTITERVNIDDLSTSDSEYVVQ